MARYGVAIVATVCAVIARWLLNPVLADRFPFALPFLAVLIAAGYGGFGPALLATALGGIASALLWIARIVGPEQVWGMPLFIVVSLGIAWIGARMFRAQREARRQAELKDAQREQLRITLASIGDAVIATDVEGRVTMLNAVAEQLTGWSAAAAVGRPLSEIVVVVDEQTRAPVANPLARALTTGRPVGLANHAVLIARDGVERPIDDSAAPIRDLTGKVSGAVMVFRDITERRRGEAAALRSQQQLEDFFENATVALHRVGADGTILRANKAELEMLGYSAEEYVGRHIAEFHVDRQVIDDLLRRLSAGETIKGVVTRMRCKDGSLKHVRIDSSVYWENGTFVHTRCFTFDVTEKVLAEAALRDNERRKDEFLALLAHELRNPLAPIHAAVEILRRRGTQDRESTAAREIIGRQARVMARLVDDLMDVSRINRGQVRLFPEPIGVDEVVERALETARPWFAERQHNVGVDLPKERLWLQADPTRLEQVLANLLNNAAKYTPNRGHIELSVRGERDAVLIEVRDDGMGMEPSFLPHAFEMFAQARRDSERGRGGLGIGLALVRKLVELHGGSILAHSDGLSRGCRFVMRLPRLPVAEVPREVLEDSTRTSGHATPSTAHAEAPGPEATQAAKAPVRRVLVVDDNADAAHSLATFLRMIGHEAETAGDAESALEAFRRQRPEVVFLDIGLPGTDGHELARLLRAETGSACPLLVALTGWGQETDRRRSREAGFDHHLVKPAEPEQVERILGQLT